MSSAAASRPALLPASAALVLAAGAAVLLQLAALLASGPEGAAEPLWVLGWALAAWAAITAAVAAVELARRHGRRSPGVLPRGLPGSAMVGAAVALLAITVWLHPFAGVGGGTG
jgi:hypothetical protein